MHQANLGPNCVVIPGGVRATESCPAVSAED